MRSSIDKYSKDKTADTHISAMFKRIDDKERKELIKTIADCKKKLALYDIKMAKVAPFSTGCLDDKVSLILVPLIASTGVLVPKFSEQNLANLKGAFAPLQSIPGLKTSFSLKEIRKQLSKTNAFLVCSPEPIALFLKKISPSEDNINLLLGNIMSLMLISDIRGAVFDIKVGDAALVKNPQEARDLTLSLRNICHQMNINSSFILSNMNQPLGQAVGNSLELIEALEILKGRGSLDLLKIVLELGTEMLLLAKKYSNRIEAKRYLKRKIIEGEALDKFKEIIEVQKGNPRIIDDYLLLPRTKEKRKILSHKKGYIQDFKIKQIKLLKRELGILRMRSAGSIDYGPGFLIYKKIGDCVEKNDVLAEVHFNNAKNASWLDKEFRGIFVISEKPPDFQPFIIERTGVSLQF